MAGEKTTANAKTNVNYDLLGQYGKELTSMHPAFSKNMPKVVGKGDAIDSINSCINKMNMLGKKMDDLYKASGKYFTTVSSNFTNNETATKVSK